MHNNDTEIVVPTTLSMKNSVFREVTAYSLVEARQRFGGMYSHHLQCRTEAKRSRKPAVLLIRVNETWMGREHNKHAMNEKCIQKFWLEDMKGSYHLED
jgi:hypothetical protein